MPGLNHFCLLHPQHRPISHRPSINSTVEEPHSILTFNTSQPHRKRRRRQPIKSTALLSQNPEDDCITLELYSSSYKDVKGLCSTSHRTLKRTPVDDPILAYITAQRSRLGLQTMITRNPDASEANTFRESLVATLAPVAGIKDLQHLSKKLAGVEREPQGDRRAVFANEFVYALRRDVGVASEYNPYNLVIVPSDRARIHSNYYTISAFNVAEVSLSSLMATP